MVNLILATEAAANPPGDEFMMVALVALGIAMLVAAIATVIVTPKADKH